MGEIRSAIKIFMEKCTSKFVSADFATKTLVYIELSKKIAHPETYVLPKPQFQLDSNLGVMKKSTT